MSKPWGRYEVNFINHDKFRSITSNAIALWIEGKNYADDKLTDGLLPAYEVKHWRFYGTKSLRLLTTSCGTKPGTDQAYAPLWEPVEGFGFKMHDYLDHNPCRDTAIARIDKAEASKEKERDRKAAWRLEQQAKSLVASAPCPVDVPPDVPRDKRDNVPDVPPLSRAIQKTEDRRQYSERTLSVPAANETDVGQRAERLLTVYKQTWYPLYRHGAKLRLISNSLEFAEACTMCETWDDARLEKLAQVVLTTNEDFVAATDRSFKIFVTKASWADDRLRQAESGAA